MKYKVDTQKVKVTRYGKEIKVDVSVDGKKITITSTNQNNITIKNAKILIS